MHGLPVLTPNLRLRHFVAEDAQAVRALNAEPSTARWLPSHVYATPEDAVSALAYLVGCYANPGDPALAPYVLAVACRRTARLLGHVGFSPLDGDVEVSYAIAEDARGGGKGAECLAHACPWIVAVFGVSRVVAHTASANLPSRRTLARAGFDLLREEDRMFQGRRERVSCWAWQAHDGGPDRPNPDVRPAA